MDGNSFLKRHGTYFVVIDLQQLRTRLHNSHGSEAADVVTWLEARDFSAEAHGWLTSADGMNTLSCSEILFSERRLLPMPRLYAYASIAS